MRRYASKAPEGRRSPRRFATEQAELAEYAKLAKLAKYAKYAKYASGIARGVVGVGA